MSRLTNAPRHWAIGLVVVGLMASVAQAQPGYVDHIPGTQVYNQPAGVTMRDPETPRESESVDLYFKMGPSSSYTSVAVYYTDDGSTPSGSKGMPFGGTMVLLSYGPDIKVNFLYNEPVGTPGVDWWHAQMPYFTRDYGERIRYKVGVWDSNMPATPEMFANGGSASEYTNKIAWPGAGSGSASPDEGYPPVHFWKEEAVAGNNYINVMIDQNGSLYDVYYPSAGCVNGMGTKNEGYVDGLDTFPALLGVDERGQMNLNQATAGLRVDGTTYWLSNVPGTDYVDVSQSYVTDTNVIATSQRLVAGGNDIHVQQYDLAPIGVTFPNDDGSSPNKGLHVKRIVLTNNGAAAKTVDFYFYADYALNGGDTYDGTYTDAVRGTMIGYDNTHRFTSSSGEYNPTTFGDYEKNVSVYIGASMKLADSVGGGGGTPAGEFWSDTSSDQGLGWIGMRVELPVGVAKEIDVLIVGGFDGTAGATGTYDYYMDNAVDWFLAGNMSAMQSATESYWQAWLADGVTIDFPDDRYDETFRRSLLATALHLDGHNGGIIAGMHNGAYPFVWPRDAAWAAITLARSGHVAEAENIYAFLRDVAYRDVEGWGREGFWKQKYSTDGYTIWGTPQVDETSCYPWGIRYIYDVVGDVQFLEDHYDGVYEAAIASSQDSTIDTRLRYEEAVDLVYSMNLWEDSFDVFNYSNASVIRGLEDAAAIADVLDQEVCPGGPGTCGYDEDRTLFSDRATAIRGGLDARLAWNGEETDISQLGITYPFEIYEPGHARVELIMDRINGVAADAFSNFHPLMNFNTHGEWEDLVNRYWGDGYWNNPSAPNADGSPWFLTTMWYGCYYAMRQDVTPGKGDIDNHKFRMDLLLDRLGPVGLGAEQIAPNNSLLYAGQTDFSLQTAWPNAWESMSFFVDSMMMFLGYTPDAPNNTLRLEPKLPTGWTNMTFSNVRLGDHRLDITCQESDTVNSISLTNITGNAIDYDVYIRVPQCSTFIGATQDDSGGCQAIAATCDGATGRVHVTGAVDTGLASSTVVRAHLGLRGDFDGLNGVDIADMPTFIDVLIGAETDCVKQLIADMNADGVPDGRDIQLFVDAVLTP